MNVLHNDKIIELLKSCYKTEKLWIFTLFLLGASLHCSSHVFNLFWFSHPKSMGHTGLQNTHIACHQFFFLKRLHIEKKMHIIEQWIAVIDLPNPFFSSQNSFGPPIVGMKAVNLEDATLKLFPLCQHPTQKPVIRKAPKYS